MHGPRAPWPKIGVVDAGDTHAPDEQALEIQDVAGLSLAELRTAWEGTLPALRLNDARTAAAAPPQTF